jgi:hypothetical protein
MKRFIVLAIIMIVICSFSSVAKTDLYNSESEKINSLNMDDYTPIWEVGNYWTYDVDTITVQLNESGYIMNIDLTVNNLKLEVKSKPTDIYVLDVSGKIAGSFLFDDGAGLRISGNLYFTRFSGEINLYQSNLSLQNGNLVIKSIALLKEHPLSIPIPIPMPLTITIDLQNNIPRSFIDFPLFDGKMGIINESFVSTNITAESIVLVILNIFKPDIPPELFFELQMPLPPLLYNASIETITINPGVFSAYNIVYNEGLFGSVYYAPTVGNIIKTIAEFSVEDTAYLKFNCELKEYNYP